MRKLFFFLISFSTLFTLKAQLKFQASSLQEALHKANVEGKLVFLQFEAATCNQCNEVADKGLNDKAVITQMEQTFVPLKISRDHPDRSAIATQYNIKEFGTFFINQSGILIHTYSSTTSFSKEYLKQMDLALEKAGEALKVDELETEYKKGNKSIGFLEVLLTKKRSLNLATEALLEEYVALLPADSLKSLRTLHFIANMAPLINSNASNLLRRDPAIFNQVWYKMDNLTRVNINNRIIYESMNKAVQQKEERYALQVASFARGTYTGNPLGGLRAYDRNMLHYYEAIGDTSTYFKKAISYYERYYMTISVDSIKRMDSLNRQRMAAMAKKDTVRTGNSMRVSSAISFSPSTQHYAWELQEGAYNFYKMTNNSYLLSVATEWSAKALTFFESPEVLDIHARLLYKQGEKEKAIAFENSAIQLKQQRGYPVKELETVLQKMKKGVSSID